MKNKIKIQDLNTNDCIRNLTEEELTIISGGVGPIVSAGVVIEGAFEAVYNWGRQFGRWLRSVF